MKRIGIYFGIVIFILFASGHLLAQFKKESKDPLEDHIILYASCQYRELPGDWKINYYGISGEDYLNNGWGMSVSFYFGISFNNIGYLYLSPQQAG
jgi:hypothetical protein